MTKLEELCSLNPALILGEENIGKIEVGYKADMVLFDENISRVIEDKTSLYYGDTVFGQVVKVFKDGHIVEL